MLLEKSKQFMNRPEIEINTDFSSEIETFQSETLRPILKMKNDTLLSIFKNQLYQKSISIAQLNEEEKLDFISKLIKNDLSLKSFFIGLIVSDFNTNELQIYLANAKEINKRITTLLIERIRSQWERVS